MEAHALLFDSAEALGLPRNGEMVHYVFFVVYKYD